MNPSTPTFKFETQYWPVKQACPACGGICKGDAVRCPRCQHEFKDPRLGLIKKLQAAKAAQR